MLEKKLNKNGDRRGFSENSRKNLALGRKTNHRTQKDYSITRILKSMADDPAPERWLEVEDKGKGFTYRQAAARRIWLDVIRGNAKVTCELLDRLEGCLSGFRKWTVYSLVSVVILYLQGYFTASSNWLRNLTL